ncbi:TIGR01244 family sulfur transferase [Pacificibacter marinus]|uniref:TIGR01244 family sulfur transferase n=1 Tax=Pacificibacter marinus TaxID=658057 RepID=UPI001C07A083|nr:TIGR01244 family sulfur transferase [Pacificibacter marinus]MBU2865406.1 TIGR01244 family phosphatase [Pacificibacter marinus]
MDFNKINDQLTVSGQILPTEVTTLVEKGFKTLICNRPDEEVEDALQSTAMETAAKAAGLNFRYIPIYPGQFTDENVSELTAAMTDLDGPIYAYCRSGTRSCTLWALSQAGLLDVDAIISQAADGGYDLRGMAAYLAGK